MIILLLYAVCNMAILDAHCQLPCGIYHDSLVFGELQEDIQTIAKAVQEIEKNRSTTPEQRNQLVRWVINKEHFADKVARTMSEYFLQQRIKENDPKLEEKLLSIYHVMLLSMKAKQTVDTNIVNHLSQELAHFKWLYMGEEEEHHH